MLYDLIGFIIILLLGIIVTYYQSKYMK